MTAPKKEKLFQFKKQGERRNCLTCGESFTLGKSDKWNCDLHAKRGRGEKFVIRQR